MKVTKQWLYALFIPALNACAPVPPAPATCPVLDPAGFDPHSLHVHVVDDGSGGKMLEVFDPPGANGCNPNKPNGCIRVSYKHTGRLDFNLVGGMNQNCQGSGTSGYKWKAIYLSSTDKDFRNPATVTGDIICDFGTDADGRVISPAFNGHKMRVEDENGSAYTAYYQLVAESCETGEEIITDPPIENTGRTR